MRVCTGVPTGFEVDLFCSRADARICCFCPRRLRERDMKLIVGMYSSWRDYECWHDLHGSPATQLNALEAEIMDRERLDADGVLVHSNVHSG